MARLVPYEGEPLPRRAPGRLRGSIRIAPDFDETPAEIIEGFDG